MLPARPDGEAEASHYDTVASHYDTVASHYDTVASHYDTVGPGFSRARNTPVTTRG